MPILRTYSTSCPSCGWEGYVSFGDVRTGPWRRADGSLFYTELICPQCEEQVNNPIPDEQDERPAITPEREQALKAFHRIFNPTRRT